MAKRVYSNSREKIISAALELMLKDSVGNLTTDAVIEASGMSKAGFFYNFKTKNELLQALSSAMMSEMLNGVKQIAEEDTVKKGRTLRALIKFCMSEHTNLNVGLGKKAIIETFLINPDGASHYPNLIKELMPEIISEKIDKVTAHLIIVALDGIWYNSIFDQNYVVDEDLNKLFEKLIAMTH